MDPNSTERGFWNWPNRLSLLRIALVPIIIYAFARRSPVSDAISAALFALAAMTDVFDGYLARRQRRVTSVGKVLDPLADKILIASALILLVDVDRVPAWMAAVLIGRDLFITALRGVLGLQGQTVPVSWLGKTKTMLLFISIVLLMWSDPLFGLDLRKAGTVLIGCATAASIWSAWDYIATFYGVSPWALVRVLRYLVPIGILRRKS